MEHAIVQTFCPLAGQILVADLEEQTDAIVRRILAGLLQLSEV